MTEFCLAATATASLLLYAAAVRFYRAARGREAARRVMASVLARSYR